MRIENERGVGLRLIPDGGVANFSRRPGRGAAENDILLELYRSQRLIERAQKCDLGQIRVRVGHNCRASDRVDGDALQCLRDGEYQKGGSVADGADRSRGGTASDRIINGGLRIGE